MVAGTLKYLAFFAAIFALPVASFAQHVVSLRLVASLEGHTDQVRKVVFSADGKLIASCSHDGTVRLWDVESKKSLATLNVQDEPLYALALSPDSKTLAIAGAGGMLTLWNVESLLKTSTYQPTQWNLTDLAWSPDGKTLIFHKRGSLLVGGSLVFMPTNGDEPTVVELGESINGWIDSMAVAQDGDRIAVGSHAATIALWSFKQKKEVAIFTGLPDDVENMNNLSTIRALAFSPTQDRLAVASGFKISSSVTAWDSQKKELTTRFAGDFGTVWGLAFSPNGKLLAGAGDALVIWDSESGKVLDKFGDNRRRVDTDNRFHAYKVAFSPNGHLIASGGFDMTVKIFSVFEE